MMRARERLHTPHNIGDAIADAVVSAMGSWKFIIIQTCIVVVWIALNVWLLVHPYDPYPLILLNLVFSTQAAYASPIILMSQNRQADKDRKRDSLEAAEVDELYQINKVQLDILNQQTEILNILHGKGGTAVVKEVKHDELA